MPSDAKSHLSSPPTERPKLLVVDDDEVTLAMIADALGERFEIVALGNGQAALAAIRETAFACVMADHLMPGVTGVELLDACHELRPQTMRILMTASESNEVYAQAVNRARVHRLLLKPLRWLELPSIVSGAIREGHLAADNRRLVQQLGDSNARLEEQVAQRTVELQTAVHRLEQLALRDGLTDLYNHRYVHDALEAEVSRAKRHGHELALLFIDVDNFKPYNDRHGHPAGDMLLKRVADLLAGGRDSGLPVNARVSDIVARYGGDEFVMILPETGSVGAGVKAERVRRRIAEFPFEHAGTQPIGSVSVSIGVATFPEHAASKEALIEVANRELASAKGLGRNRVCIAGADAATQR
jgi:diguanylate cyclase (GGDEF)-like protein